MAVAVSPYTRKTVEPKLIRGYGALEGRPCMTRGPRLVEGHAPREALALNWVQDFVHDREERTALLGWLRCQVKGESWCDQCRSMGWTKRTRDRQRARAMTHIVNGLNRLTLSQSASEP